jgi:hypothetical protein
MTAAEDNLRRLLQRAVPAADAVEFAGVATAARRRRRMRAGGAVASLALAVGVAVVVPSVVAGSPAPPRVPAGGQRGGPVTSTIYLNEGDETFAPPPKYMHPSLTAEQAFEHFAHKPIPDTVTTYELGILTSPPSVTDVLVWGFTGQAGGCMTMGGPLVRPGSTPQPRPTAPPRRCREWDFISATTGRFVLGTGEFLPMATPTPTPTPPEVVALHSGGFLGWDQQRFSWPDLVLQGPESTIRWTFHNPTCSIRMHWFLPPATQSSRHQAPCPWTHRFTTNVVTDLVSRGRVFTVVAGYVPSREHYQVKATLADGRTESYWAADSDAAWMFMVQRCGDVTGTAVKSVSLIRIGHGMVDTAPIVDTGPLVTPSAIEQHCHTG